MGFCLVFGAPCLVLSHSTGLCEPLLESEGCCLFLLTFELVCATLAGVAFWLACAVLQGSVSFDFAVADVTFSEGGSCSFAARSRKSGIFDGSVGGLRDVGCKSRL